ncbi:helix-turn-helix transcriptional regulator [Raineyella sp. W15-4]|uniref:helix-turn-helix transcriptional regulator n=1 Tax=Raineyella sp. W15-4 TaxID=3081651 RepID=UPI002953E0A2|nr:LuxR C-terminal-related transcriptional regulator [Raineyella sp. W15-4]WOQ16212.1 LuxR C-terminal-related transcriptional regulator [Raineyella sp. W15-4]
MGVVRRGDQLLFWTDPTGTGEERAGELTVGAVRSLRDVPDGIVVLQDYALLASSSVTELIAPPMRLSMLPPAGHRARSEDAASVAQDAVREPEALVTVTPTTLRRLRPYVTERADVDHRLSAVAARILAVLGEYSPELAQLLSRDGVLHPGAAALLRRYPTPRALMVEGHYALVRTLNPGSDPEREALAEGVFRLGSGSGELPGSREAEALAEALVPGLATEYELLRARGEAIDRAIFALVAPAPSSPSLRSRLGRPTVGVAARVPEPTPFAGARDVGTLVAATRAAYESRYHDPSTPDVAYAQYRGAREALDDFCDTPDPITGAEIAVWGQFLAIDCGDFSAEAAYSAAVRRTLPTGADRGVDTVAAVARIRADSEIAHAIAGVLGADPSQEFDRLRRALDTSPQASDRVRREGLGLLALVLAIWGRTDDARALLASLPDRAGEESGAADVPAHIARLLVVPSVAEDDTLRSAREIAAEASRGTAYEAYFQFANMFTSLITKSFVPALKAFDRWSRSAAWRRQTPDQRHLAHLVQALISAAVGDYSGIHDVFSHRSEIEFSDLETPPDLMGRSILARVDLSVGSYGRVLAATSPQGELSEAAVARAYPRGVPAPLVLRGSVLWELQQRRSAVEHFERALRWAAIHEDWVVLLVAETPQFRNWLTSLDPHHPPEGVPAGVPEAITGRPILVDRAIPSLTDRQRRVLALLSVGKSTDEIAKEMFITRNTVKTHLRQLYRKLGVSTREEAVGMAERYQLLT